MLSFREGDPDRPRGHAFVVFHDADDPAAVWATYLVVPPIAVDIGKYIPPAFAQQMGAMAAAAQTPAAYPLPPIPEKGDGGRAEVERLARLRGDDLLDGGTLRFTDPWQVLNPLTQIGAEYAEKVSAYLASPPAPPRRMAADDQPAPLGPATDVDALLLQVMPDRDKIGRLVRLLGTLRYAVEGGDGGLVEDTAREMDAVGRHLPDKYRAAELIAAALSATPQAGRLAQLYVDRAYRLLDEDYAALPDLEAQIERLRAP